jgi:hypothetical protein
MNTCIINRPAKAGHFDRPDVLRAPSRAALGPVQRDDDRFGEGSGTLTDG